MNKKVEYIFFIRSGQKHFFWSEGAKSSYFFLFRRLVTSLPICPVGYGEGVWSPRTSIRTKKKTVKGRLKKIENI